MAETPTPTTSPGTPSAEGPAGPPKSPGGGFDFGQVTSSPYFAPGVGAGLGALMGGLISDDEDRLRNILLGGGLGAGAGYLGHMGYGAYQDHQAEQARILKAQQEAQRLQAAEEARARNTANAHAAGLQQMGPVSVTEGPENSLDGKINTNMNQVLQQGAADAERARILSNEPFYTDTEGAVASQQRAELARIQRALSNNRVVTTLDKSRAMDLLEAGREADGPQTDTDPLAPYRRAADGVSGAAGTLAGLPGRANRALHEKGRELTDAIAAAPNDLANEYSQAVDSRIAGRASLPPSEQAQIFRDTAAEIRDFAEQNNTSPEVVMQAMGLSESDRAKILIQLRNLEGAGGLEKNNSHAFPSLGARLGHLTAMTKQSGFWSELLSIPANMALMGGLGAAAGAGLAGRGNRGAGAGAGAIGGAYGGALLSQLGGALTALSTPTRSTRDQARVDKDHLRQALKNILIPGHVYHNSYKRLGYAIRNPALKAQKKMLEEDERQDGLDAARALINAEKG